MYDTKNDVGHMRREEIERKRKESWASWTTVAVQLGRAQKNKKGAGWAWFEGLKRKQPMVGFEYREYLSIFKSFINRKSIRIQIKLELWTTSIHKIKYNNTHQYKRECVAAWNATNNYIKHKLI
jgi:hypothetical protein